MKRFKRAIACILAAALTLGGIPASAVSPKAAALPSDISGLKAWYDANDLTAADGERISEWKNKAGSADFDAVQTDSAKQPEYKLHGDINNKAGVKFNKRTFLQLKNQFDLDDMSIFAVINPETIESASDTNQIFSKLSNSDPWNHNWWFNLKPGAFNFGWKDIDTWRDYTGGGNSVTAGKSYLVGGTKSSALGRLYINGDKIGEMSGNAQNPAALHNDQPITIGGTGMASSMIGTVSEIVVFDRGLTDSEAAQVNEYLMNKWGVGVGENLTGEIAVDGKPIAAFTPDTSNYKYTLKKGTAAAPAVTAQFDGAQTTVTQADSPNGTAQIDVNVNGVTKTYTVEFSVMDKSLLNLKKPDIEDVAVTDGFWKDKLDMFARTTVNYVFDNFERTGTLKNFEKVASGGGSPEGATDPWNDGLLYESIRGASDFLRANPDPELEKRIDGYIDIIYDAAQKDTNGYLSTHAMLQKTGKYFDATGNAIWYHDAYNFGCMCEAAVHYYKATGKVKLLYVATRFAEFITANYGYGKINMVPSHEGPEEMLLNLYQLYKSDPQAKAKVASFKAGETLSVNEDMYAELVKFWIENRGNFNGREGAGYGVYAQDHARYFDQLTGEGHAVRANLFYLGMAAAGAQFEDYTYLSTADEIWHNIKESKMYLTGGVGATADGEAYGAPYDLPNDGYCETCAQVAMGFFSEAMSRAFGDSEYADMVEKYIYNGVLGCAGEDGKSFYYQQPLSNENPRWTWIDHTPCCPPMFLKFYSELRSYIYSYDDSSVYLNQFISSRAAFENGVEIEQTSDMPTGGKSTVKITGKDTTLFVRVPDWAGDITVRLNGNAVNYTTENGYAKLNAKNGDIFEIEIPMIPRREYANENVLQNTGKVALAYGPLVYTFEKDDNGAVRNFASNGGNFGLPKTAELKAKYDPDLLGGIIKITAQGETYSFDGKKTTCELTAVPFYARSNRASKTSFVWVNEQAVPSGGTSLPILAQALNSTRDLGSSPAAALDGKPSTCWTAASSAAPQTFVVDLGKQADIAKVSLAFKKSYNAEYKIITSADMQTWYRFASGNADTTTETLAFMLGAKETARYVAVQFTRLPADEFISLCELGVYAPDSTSNLALRKMCGATSYENAGDSVFAMIDGEDTTRYCPAGETKPQSLLLDLGNITKLDGISIQFEKPTDWTYNIAVSDDGETYTDYIRETYKMQNDGDVRNINKAAAARYIKLSITGTTNGVWASVWELKLKTADKPNVFAGVKESERPKPEPKPEPKPKPVLTLAKKEVALTLGKSETLKTVNTTGKPIVWSSSNKNVRVANGKITAKKVGRAVVTATAGGKTATVTVTVIPKAVKKFTVTKKGRKVTVKIKKADKSYKTYIEYRKGKAKFKKLTLTKAKKFTKKLKKGKYQLRAYSYIRVSGRVYKSAPSRIKKITIK